MESHCYIPHKSCTCRRIGICSALSRWMCKGEHSSSSCLLYASHIYHGYPICHLSWWSHTLNCYPYSFQKPSCHISTGFHRSTANFLICFLCMLQSKLREALKRWNFNLFLQEGIPFLIFKWENVWFNSLLPLGRYIDMDPSTTELVISQTQFIRFGQFLLGWICDNQLHFPSIIAGNTKVKSWSQ